MPEIFHCVQRFRAREARATQVSSRKVFAARMDSVPSRCASDGWALGRLPHSGRKVICSKAQLFSRLFLSVDVLAERMPHTWPDHARPQATVECKRCVPFVPGRCADPRWEYMNMPQDASSCLNKSQQTPVPFSIVKSSASLACLDVDLAW